ncbi:hypothetical protein [Helicobacter cetorum]|uniref:Uncharacterized protein n=1 Tax=Helicobacter cetorum (strain ATCC BAA-540 / CCUG 52418 / MIT 99-5656) TaxID=1163745 RepID=I0EQY7_HELCM|nr:hypothetical protein [Helicobacter cetorum]AFI05356.1 hypothetical protein HCD_01620 [Helicobacter cetorum MIT 99-5656]
MFLVKKMGVVMIVVGCFLACSQESFIKMQKRVHQHENDGSRRPSYVDSDYKVISESLLKDESYRTTDETNAQSVYNQEDFLNEETSLYLLNEQNTRDKEKSPFLYQPRKGIKWIEYSQQSFYPLKDRDVMVSKNGSKFFIEVKSKALKRFLNQQNKHNKERQIQTFAFDNTKTQIMQLKGKIFSYVYTKNKSNLSLRPFYEAFQLEKKSDNVYLILGDRDVSAINIQKCQMVLKKRSVDKLDSQHRAISINLDFKKGRFKSYTELFLECLK